jgi:2-oxoglutarate ferredoxin oxidoreductase subunit alpha
VLSDGYIANGAEPWKIPSVSDLPKIEIRHPEGRNNGTPFKPYERNEQLSRPWALPGTPGLTHRIGGLEKEDVTGNISYDPKNHQHMVNTRAKKVANIASMIPATEVDGPNHGVLVVSWGGTYGACRTAVHEVRDQGAAVAHVHLRWLNPLPSDLGGILSRYKKVLVPELNTGHLSTLLRAKYLIDIAGFNKVQGKPFAVSEVVAEIRKFV